MNFWIRGGDRRGNVSAGVVADPRNANRPQGARPEPAFHRPEVIAMKNIVNANGASRSIVQGRSLAHRSLSASQRAVIGALGLGANVVRQADLDGVAGVCGLLVGPRREGRPEAVDGGRASLTKATSPLRAAVKIRNSSARAATLSSRPEPSHEDGHRPITHGRERDDRGQLAGCWQHLIEVAFPLRRVGTGPGDGQIGSSVRRMSGVSILATSMAPSVGKAWARSVVRNMSRWLGRQRPACWSK